MTSPPLFKQENNMTTEDYFPIALSKIPVLSDCSPQALARLVPFVRVDTFSAGDIIYQPGDPVTQMYYIIQGHIWLKPGNHSDKIYDIEVNHDESLKVEQFFGEEAAIQAEHYLTTAIAVCSTTVLVFDQQGLKSLFNTHPEQQPALYESLIDRITTEQVFKLKRPPKKVQEAGSYRTGIGWLLAIILPALVFHLAKDHPQLTFSMASYFAIFSAAVVMWVFRLVEEYIPAIFIVVAVIILGLAPSQVILEGYASGSFFMALSVFGISAVLLQSGLTYRLSLLILRLTPGSGIWHVVSMFLLGVLLTPIIPTANGRSTLIAPLLNDVINLLRYQHGGVAATRMASAAFMGISVLSAGFLTSKSVNFALFGLFPQQVKDQFSWGYWVYASMIAMLVLFMGYFIHSALFFKTQEQAKFTRRQIVEQLDTLGIMQWEEWASLFGIILFICGVLTTSIHKIQPPWIGLAILFLMLTLGCLSKKELRTHIDWPFLLMLGGFVGMVKTMNFLAIDQWIAHQLTWVGHFMSTDFYLFVLVLGLVIYAIRLVVPNNATIILVAALFMPVAIAQGVNPWIIAFIVLIFSDGWIFPYQCSYYIQLTTLTDKEKIFSKQSLLLFVIQSNIIRFIAVYASIPYWQYLGLL